MAAKVPFNDVSRLSRAHAASLCEAAADVVRSGCFVLGPAVARFERAFADYCGTSHCIGVGNGTDALELALRALGIRPGQTVLVPANAAMYATTAVLAIRADPHFMDVDPVYGLSDADALQAALDQCDTTPAAMVVTHLYGRLATSPALLELARSRGIPVVEDCAQAHGARDGSGCRAGSFGSIAAFSFYPTKNLGALGDGGAVMTDHDGLAANVRRLRQYGWGEKYTNVLAGGRNSRLDELQAAFLCTLLPILDTRNDRRRAIANRYSREIRNATLSVPPQADVEYVAHLYVVQCEDRDGLRAHLHGRGIACEVHYPVADHRQPVHAARYAHVRLPVTESLSRRVLSIPCFPELTDQEVDRVISACNDFTVRQATA